MIEPSLWKAIKSEVYVIDMIIILTFMSVFKGD